MGSQVFMECGQFLIQIFKFVFYFKRYKMVRGGKKEYFEEDYDLEFY